MVTVVDYTQRTSVTGKNYFVLIIQGGIELVKSRTSEMHYATAMRCSIPTTFEEYACKSMLGKELPGEIVKTSCEPYEVLNRKTGEMVRMNFRYIYSPVEKNQGNSNDAAITAHSYFD